jgi:hypothetical protein
MAFIFNVANKNVFHILQHKKPLVMSDFLIKTATAAIVATTGATAVITARTTTIVTTGTTAVITARATTIATTGTTAVIAARATSTITTTGATL